MSFKDFEKFKKRRKKNKGKPRFSRFKALPIHDEIKEKLLAGIPLRKIADWIQDQGFCGDLQRDSLAKALHRYQKSFKDAVVVQTHMPQVAINAKEKLKNGLDEMEAMHELYLIQL